MDEKITARRYDTPYRDRGLTDHVYEGELPPEGRAAFARQVLDSPRRFFPAPPEYSIWYGELHGHSDLSDGRPSPDEYYIHLRDVAGLDFGVLTDHTHGGLGKETLLGEKFEQLRVAAIKYNDPGRFSTLLGYEIEGYPYYNNLVLYHRDFDATVINGRVSGDLAADELAALLARRDVIAVPHDTYHLESGADFASLPMELMTPLIQLYSRGNSAEYFGNPQFEFTEYDGFMCEGGYWQDALRRGAKMGCIGASDSHNLTGGVTDENETGIARHPGITGVLAAENTPEAIFDALAARRCYCFTGGRIAIDFRIDGHCMGEEFVGEGRRAVWFRVEADAPIDRITLVKNCRDYIVSSRQEYLLWDNKAEQPVDCYYLRVLLRDGRCGWTSPIWVLQG